MSSKRRKDERCDQKMSLESEIYCLEQTVNLLLQRADALYLRASELDASRVLTSKTKVQMTSKPVLVQSPIFREVDDELDELSSSSSEDEGAYATQQQIHFSRLAIEQYQSELRRNPQNSYASARLISLQQQLESLRVSSADPQ
eukprot:TRINITY_DN1685_c0_g1_i1.p1 TRINITY_DN1685_c0_g1~~TRINITY_DN1685_c0_g1_i1.p1  ORF type:complete len:144 (+),score=16.42 TRINITY_DN1685_c0_g1_i1:117-548(+)